MFWSPPDANSSAKASHVDGAGGTISTPRWSPMSGQYVAGLADDRHGDGRKAPAPEGGDLGQVCAQATPGSLTGPCHSFRIGAPGSEWRATSMIRYARLVYAGLAWLFAAAIVLQVFLIG